MYLYIMYVILDSECANMYFTCDFQPTRDVIPVVHIPIQDPPLHNLEKLQVVLHNWSTHPPPHSTLIPLYLFIPGKYSP